MYGEEGYLKKQYKDRFVRAMVREGDTVNYMYREGAEVNVAEVIDQAETMPFFAEHRLIVLENTGLFKGAGDRRLSDYIREMPDTTYMIFVENEADKRGRLYKAVKETGYAAELGRQDERSLCRWITGRARDDGKELSPENALYFLNKTGTDMNTISTELEKVLTYALERDIILKEDIDAVCVEQTGSNIFAMIEAAAAGRQREALDLYYGLLAAKEPPMRILFLMTRQYRYMFEIKSYAALGMGRAQIAQKTGLHPFVAGKYLEQSKKFEISQLRAVLEESADLEESVKTGKLADVLAVELFLIKYSAGAAAGKR